VSMDLEEQYDKIYRYCYFKVHNKELAEDITQETFLKFFGSEKYSESGKSLRYLYTIARNLCIDEYRKLEPEAFDENISEDVQITSGHEDEIINKLVLKEVLNELPEEDRELVLLRYVNEVSVGTICSIFGMSRFALYRRLNKVLDSMKQSLEGRKL